MKAVIAMTLLAASVAACSRAAPNPPPAPPEARQPAGAELPLSVERTATGGFALRFRFPDRPSVVPEINRLDVGKVGLDVPFCVLTIVDMQKPGFAGRWVVGTVPPNFRGEQCGARGLAAGDYEIQWFSQRGEDRARVHVAPSGAIDVLPWERESP